MMDNHHGKEVLFAIRSAPVGYAAEYLTCGAFAAIPMGSFPLMSMNCILYHFPSLHVLLDYNHFVYFVVQIFEHTSVG